MRLIPSPLQIGDEEGFTKGNDLFELGDYGKQLAALMCRTDEPLIVILDGQWGSGKSVFAQQWAGLLRQSDTPVVLIDAFANDFIEDPFLLLASELKAVVEKRFDATEQKEIADFAESTIRTAAALTPTAANIAFKALTAGQIGFNDIQEASKSVSEAHAKHKSENSPSFLGSIEHELSSISARQETIRAFRENVQRIASLLSQSNDTGDEKRKAGFIFIIDELDRCRPSFAIEMVETAKHLFSVPSVKFQLVTNLDQLEAAVRGRYGSTVDAKTYLEKFYHLRVSLPESKIDHPSTSRTSRYIHYLWNHLELDKIRLKNEEIFDLDEIVRVSIALNLSLRSIERIMSNISLAFMAFSNMSYNITEIVMVLCILRHHKREDFEKIKRNSYKSDDLVKIGVINDKNEKGSIEEWRYNFWRYLLSEEIDKEHRLSFVRTLGRHFRDNKDTLKEAAISLDRLLVRVKQPL